MISVVPRILANAIWLLGSLPDAIAFRRASRSVAACQRRVLRRIVRRNQNSRFGRRHRFDQIKSVRSFQDKVPLSSYDDFQGKIARIAAGERRVLTHERVLSFEPTSGSTAPSKLIPTTASLKNEFQRGIAPWAVRTLLRSLRLLLGTAYWSISPIGSGESRTSAGIPIGFEDDSDYLGKAGDWLARSAFAVPPTVRLVDNVESWRYVTLLFLLRSRELSYLSIWHPTFLILLLKPLADWWERLAEDIERGRIADDVELAPELRGQLNRRLGPDPRRAGQVRRAFGAGGNLGLIVARLWPHLRLLSCWTDAAAATYLPELRALVPQATIEPKGLIATEAFVSLPVGDPRGAALAIRSHFFEFLPEGARAEVRPLLAHQIRIGERYSVIVTTGGGLCRYQLFDLIEVTGRWRDCPLIRLTGKSNRVSDHFGEKLNEQHIQSVLAAALGSLQPAFQLIALDDSTGSPRYAWFIEAPDATDDVLRRIATRIEAGLSENFHYRYCRDLGQLGPLSTVRIAKDGLACYSETCRQRGQRLGDIKPALLDRESGWSRRFTGTYLAE